MFFVNTFAQYLFYRREEESSGKAFKVIMLYILLPVFVVLLAVLYAYLFKALMVRTLPNGQINLFVSCASCAYIVFYFVLREHEAVPAVRAFYRFGALVLIPLVCVQIVAVGIRLHAYGFTGWRFSSLLFIIFLAVMLALSFVKNGSFAHYGLLFLAAVILFASVTPFNLINSAYKSQYARMEKILYKYELFDGETLGDYDRDALERTITREDRDALYGSYWYVQYTSDLPAPEWMRTENKKAISFSDLFGIASDLRDENVREFEFSGTDYAVYDISLFNTMKYFDTSFYNGKYIDGVMDDYGAEMSRIRLFDNNGRAHDITDFLLALSGEDSTKTDDPLWYNDGNVSFCFTEITFTYNEERQLFGTTTVKGYRFAR